MIKLIIFVINFVIQREIIPNPLYIISLLSATDFCWIYFTIFIEENKAKELFYNADYELINTAIKTSPTKLISK